MRFTLKLETPCPECGGCGCDQDRYPHEPVRPCPRCNGDGYFLTDEGAELIDFVRRHTKQWNAPAPAAGGGEGGGE